MTRSAEAGPRSARPKGGSGRRSAAFPWLGWYSGLTASDSRGGGGTGFPAESVSASPGAGARDGLLLKVICGLIWLDSLPLLGKGRDAAEASGAASGERRRPPHPGAHRPRRRLDRRSLRRGRLRPVLPRQERPPLPVPREVLPRARLSLHRPPAAFPRGELPRGDCAPPRPGTTQGLSYLHASSASCSTSSGKRGATPPPPTMFTTRPWAPRQTELPSGTPSTSDA